MERRFKSYLVSSMDVTVKMCFLFSGKKIFPPTERFKSPESEIQVSRISSADNLRIGNLKTTYSVDLLIQEVFCSMPAMLLNLR